MGAQVKKNGNGLKGYWHGFEDMQDTMAWYWNERVVYGFEAEGHNGLILKWMGCGVLANGVVVDVAIVVYVRLWVVGGAEKYELEMLDLVADTEGNGAVNSDSVFKMVA